MLTDEEKKFFREHNPEGAIDAAIAQHRERVYMRDELVQLTCSAIAGLLQTTMAGTAAEFGARAAVIAIGAQERIDEHFNPKEPTNA